VSLFRHDRRLGENIRTRVERLPGGLALAKGAANVVSPLFHLAVGATLAEPGHRATGIRMLAAGVGAAMIARALRDRIGRPRPGDREEGGFPSRHAAAATAIAMTAAPRRPTMGLALSVIAAVGLLGRIGSGQHEPADIVAGALLGALVASVVALLLAPARLLLRGVGVR